MNKNNMYILVEKEREKERKKVERAMAFLEKVERARELWEKINHLAGGKLWESLSEDEWLLASELFLFTKK